MYLYLLNKQNIEISFQEIKSLNESAILENYIVLCNDLIVDRLAFTKEIHNVLGTDFNSISWDAIITGTYKLEGVLIDRADDFYSKLSEPKVDVRHPEFIISKINNYYCNLVWKNSDKFEDRRAHLRKINHPTSLHPRLARAMVNMANSNQILDPFCGTGGILIESAKIGLNTIGYDISKDMLEKARLNLDSYNLSAELKLNDATKLQGSFEAIVTDVPYGKNSSVTNVDLTVQKFIDNSFNLTKTLVIAYPNFLNVDFGKWSVINSFDYYLHKSLTKKVVLLKHY